MNLTLNRASFFMDPPFVSSTTIPAENFPFGAFFRFLKIIMGGNFTTVYPSTCFCIPAVRTTKYINVSYPVIVLSRMVICACSWMIKITCSLLHIQYCRISCTSCLYFCKELFRSFRGIYRKLLSDVGSTAEAKIVAS